MTALLDGRCSTWIPKNIAFRISNEVPRRRAASRTLVTKHVELHAIESTQKHIEQIEAGAYLRVCCKSDCYKYVYAGLETRSSVV